VIERIRTSAGLLTVLTFVIFFEKYFEFSIVILGLSFYELWKNFRNTEKIWLIVATIHCLGILAINLPMRKEDIIFIIGVVFANDSAALIGGKYLNFFKKPIFPKTSPKKTWGGFFWGIFGGISFALIFNYYFSVISERKTLLVVATLIVLFAVLGDFVESFIKRKAEIKDSGKDLFTGEIIFAGHGGAYDRFDALSFVFAGIFLFGFLWKIFFWF